LAKIKRKKAFNLSFKLSSLISKKRESLRYVFRILKKQIEIINRKVFILLGEMAFLVFFKLD